MSIETQWARILRLSFPEGRPPGAVESIRDEHSPISPEPDPTPMSSLPAHGGNFTLCLPTDCNPPITSTGQEHCNIIGPRNSLLPHRANSPAIWSRDNKKRKRRHRALDPDQTPTSGSKTPKGSGERPGMYKKRKRYLPDTPGADNIFEVKFLVFHRAIPSGKTSKFEYLVYWAGDWPLDQRYTWEPEENIYDGRLVGAYWRCLLDFDLLSRGPHSNSPFKTGSKDSEVETSTKCNI